MGMVVMEWDLSCEFSITDIKTGFVIYLLSGSWLKPDRLTIKAPLGMKAPDQAKYLRLGLKFAKESKALEA
jgi:hypothetical protein